MNENNFNVDETRNTNSNEMSNEFVDAPKRKILLVITIIIILLIIGFASFIFIKKYFENQNSIKILISNSFDTFEEKISEKNNQNAKLSLKLQNNSSHDDIIKLLSKIDFSMDISIDYENMLIDSDYQINYNNQKLLNANIYTESDAGYIMLEDIYDKYIKFDLKDLSIIFSQSNIKDQIIVIESIRKALDLSLKDEYFTIIKETVDGEKVTKTTLILDQKNYNSLKKDIVNTLLKDTKFLESYAKLKEIEVEDVKTSLNDSLSSNDEYDTTNLSLYTNKSKFIKLEISDSSNNISITKDGNNYDYTLDMADSHLLYGTVTVILEEDNSTINISVNDDASNISFVVTIDASVQKIASVEKKDITESIYASDITESELEKIQNNILNQEGIMNFLNDIISQSE